MNRRGFFAAFLPAAAAPAATQPDEFGVNLAAHLANVWDLSTAYFGCDEAIISKDTCKAHRARVDRRMYDTARKSAAKFFQFNG